MVARGIGVKKRSPSSYFGKAIAASPMAEAMAARRSAEKLCLNSEASWENRVAADQGRPVQ